jgi:glycosyltransferase involved in cell wall biosynthesis
MRQIVIVFWDLGIGGIQTRIQGLIQKIIHQHQDVEVTLLLYERRENEVKIIDHPRVNIKIFPGPKKFMMFGIKKKFWRFTTLQFNWWLFRELLKIRPQRLITFLNRITTYVLPYVLLSRWFLGKKVKFIINEPVIISKYLAQYETWPWPWLVTLNYRLADKIIVAAQAVKNDLINNFHAPKDKIIIVRSWVADQ